MTKVKNKSVLITGCSSGIGLRAAETLQARGYNVIASVRKDEDVERLIARGLKHVIQLDLCCSASIASGVDSAMALCHGELYALFNNAAYGQPGAVEDLSRATLRKQFETNVFGTHELTIKVLPHLLKQNQARIIQNSSILGFAAMPMRGAYNASKFALEGLSDTLRLELRETKVKISIIEPGPILSNFRQNALLALQANIDIANSRHQHRYQSAIMRLTKPGATSTFTLSADAVVSKVIHALESKRPQERYYVTVPTYLFAGLRHILPTRFLDKLAIMAADSEGK